MHTLLYMYLHHWCTERVAGNSSIDVISPHHQSNIRALSYDDRVIHPAHRVQNHQPYLKRRHQMFLIEEHDIERVWSRAGLYRQLQVESVRGMVGISLNFTDSIWVTATGKEFRCTSGGCCLSDDVTGIKGEVFLNESAFRMVKVEYPVHPLSLGLDFDFEHSQEVTMGCLKVDLREKISQYSYTQEPSSIIIQSSFSIYQAHL